MAWRSSETYFPKTTPREVKGGIRAQSLDGGRWWARRWLAVLEGFQIGARLQRGRSYARQGQVIAIAIEKGRITAKVQGSRARPYSVEIRMKMLTAEQWQNVAAVLSREAAFAARLLAGEMPEHIEDAFRTAGVPMFPAQLDDLETRCSCPDWSNPCKHIAAVYYLIGEEFDRDPFLLFRLRGMDRKEVLGLIASRPAAAAEEAPPAGPIPAEGARNPRRRRAKADAAAAPAPAGEPLPADPARFWGNSERTPSAVEPAVLPRAAAALPRRLGNFPFWRGQEPFLSALDALYRAASVRGLDVFAEAEMNRADPVHIPA